MFTILKFILIQLLDSITGRSQIITGPDFENQTSKAIHITGLYRIEYQVPNNFMEFMNFAENYKALANTMIVKNLNNMEYGQQDWRETICYDMPKWEYFKGTSNVPYNNVASLYCNIDIQKHSANTKDLSTLQTWLDNTYKDFLEGENGVNTQTRKDHPKYTDEELDSLLGKQPEFKISDINGVNFINWYSHGESRSHILQYYMHPLDSSHLLSLQFEHNFHAKNQKELDKIKGILENNMRRMVEQIHIIPLNPKKRLEDH